MYVAVIERWPVLVCIGVQVELYTIDPFGTQ